VYSTDYKIEEIHFEDDNLIADRDRAFQLFSLMAERTPHLHWNVPNGISPGLLDDGLLEIMSKSGCYEVALAVESGNDRILTKVMNRPHQYLPDLPQIISTCKRLGIFVHGFFVIGWPSETLAEAKITLKTPFEFGFMDATMLSWVPIPGTKLYRDGIKLGMIQNGDVSFSDIHMSARIPRRKGIPIQVLERMISWANLRMKLRLLCCPVLFYRRFVRPFLQNPSFGIQYLLDQVSLVLNPWRTR